MKKILFTFAIVLFAVAAEAQTSIKVHSNGQISLQSSTTSYGIQIPANGVMSIEPNVTTFGMTSETLARSFLAKAWCVSPKDTPIQNIPNTFYVTGNGNVYSYGSYLTLSPPSIGSKGSQPIEDASELVSLMKGYFLDSNEFYGITPEEIENCGNVKPEAIEGVIRDLENSRIVGLLAEDLEEILPEAVRHDPNGFVGINYNAVVTILVEAFKEQQARIDQLESILRENDLLK